MTLGERITQDTLTAQKAGDELRLSTLRLLAAQIKNSEIERRSSASTAQLSDADILNVLQREAKKRREAAELYAKGNRDDLRAREEAELAILQEYLPAQMSRDEVVEVVSRVRKSGGGDFASLMKAVMAEVRGRADGKLVSEVVREALS